jgi:hypothetical protein
MLARTVSVLWRFPFGLCYRESIKKLVLAYQNRPASKIELIETVINKPKPALTNHGMQHHAYMGIALLVYNKQLNYIVNGAKHLSRNISWIKFLATCATQIMYNGEIMQECWTKIPTISVCIFLQKIKKCMYLVVSNCLICRMGVVSHLTCLPVNPFLNIVPLSSGLCQLLFETSLSVNNS